MGPAPPRPSWPAKVDTLQRTRKRRGMHGVICDDSARALDRCKARMLHDAIKHSHAQGRLSVKPTRTTQYATLVVGDSGPGIGAGLRQRLLQPLGRVMGLNA